jgi:ABC-type Co2+ transport system permease subunit
MHIEPGYVAAAKVVAANVGAVGLVGWGLREQLKEIVAKPWMPLKTILAAGFFSLFMQSFHMSVGPSELHFVGAMAMYLTLGFTPTLIGFAIGLLFQGMLFDPQDIYHLGINSLSLMAPLVAVHYAMGKRYFDQSMSDRLTWVNIIKLDAMYYAGVTGMVGFWLMIGEVATPFTAWLTFASSYLALVVLEPVVSYGAVRLMKAYKDNGLVARLTVANELKVA